MNFLELYDKAFEYASKKHAKQKRKGTKIPYIVHLYEVSQYLREEGADENTIIAGILHDVVEDAGATLEEIKNLFGEEVANMVGFESENKALPYVERKKLHMKEIKKSNDKVKLVNCADKLSNLKSIYLDLVYFGDIVWNRFNSTKENIKFYYNLALDALQSISDKNIYKKLQYYYDKVFN